MASEEREEALLELVCRPWESTHSGCRLNCGPSGRDDGGVILGPAVVTRLQGQG